MGLHAVTNKEVNMPKDKGRKEIKKPKQAKA
jgi:hypothetical protein